MTVVSYRFRCSECSNEEVIRECSIDDSPWKIESIPYHEGKCPRCNDIVKLSNLENSAQYEESLRPVELDHIGEKAAQNLREAGYDTAESIAEADDSEILDVSWVGDKALASLKEAAMELEPQKRWD